MINIISEKYLYSLNVSLLKVIKAGKIIHMCFNPGDQIVGSKT